MSVMIASDILFVLDDWQPAHFAAPMDESRIEQASSLQVDDKSSGGLVGDLTHVWQSRQYSAMVIPVLITRVDLYEANATFDQPTSEQASRAVFRTLGII